MPTVKKISYGFALTCFAFSSLSAMELAYLFAPARNEKSDGLGEQLLCQAASSGNSIGCCFLIECGVNVNTSDDLGCTPLTLAFLNHHPEVCKLLINNGATPNLIDSESNTDSSADCTSDSEVIDDSVQSESPDPEDATTQKEELLPPAQQRKFSCPEKDYD